MLPPLRARHAKRSASFLLLRFLCRYKENEVAVGQPRRFLILSLNFRVQQTRATDEPSVALNFIKAPTLNQHLFRFRWRFLVLLEGRTPESSKDLLIAFAEDGPTFNHALHELF